MAMTIFAQNDWKTKDFDKWSAKDVQTILNKSDWIQKQSLKVSSGSYLSRIAGATTVAGEDYFTSVGGVTSPIEVTITIRLRSSMAVRLALIRQLQIETDATKLTPEEKTAFLKKQRGLYDCPACAENYVVTVSSISIDDKQFDLVYNSFKNFKLEQFKNFINLQNEKGEKRELVHFVPPKSPAEEAQFFFKRFDEKGNPLLTKDSKFFLFRLEPFEVNSPANFKVEVKPLVVGENVDF